MRLIVFRHDKQSRRILINTVYDSRAQYAADTAQMIERIQQRVDERSLRCTVAHVHRHALGLVHHRKIGVLVYDFDRDIFWFYRIFRRFGHGELHAVARLDFRARFFCRRSVDGDVPLFDEFFQTGTGELVRLFA